MVEATYEGYFIEVQLHIDVLFEKYGFFLSLVYKFLPFIRDKNCLKPDIRVQIFGDFTRCEW